MTQERSDPLPGERPSQGTATETPPRRSDAGHWANPVRALVTGSVPTGAVDLNVTGRRLHGAAGGFGRLWQKTFWVRLDGATASPQEVIRTWKERFAEFWPEGQKMFLPATGIAPGEVGLINSTMRGAPTMATGILVIYADDESFSFLSPEGHPFVGPLTFSARAEDGVTVVEVQELIRASDPLWELMMMTPGVGQRMQNDIWMGTLRNLARHFGVDAEISSRIVCVDKRRQWRHARNIVYNAGIRSALHALARPFRRRR